MDLYCSVKAQDYSAKWDEINKCPVCLCELFDDIEIDEDEKDQAKVHRDLMEKLRKNQKELI